MRRSNPTKANCYIPAVLINLGASICVCDVNQATNTTIQGTINVNV